MDANLIWSIVLSAVGIMGMYLAGSKNLWGWVGAFSAQVLWIIFAVATKQYGFILSALAYGWVYGRNYMKWRRESRKTKDEAFEEWLETAKTIDHSLARAAVSLEMWRRCNARE